MLTWWNCPHPLTEENTRRVGRSETCLMCHATRMGERRAATLARNAAICREWQAGATDRDIAERHDLARRTVRRVLGEAGLIGHRPASSDPFFGHRALRVAAAEVGAAPDELLGRGGPRCFTRARWAVAAAMRERGSSLPRIGKVLGVDHSSVRFGLRELPFRLAHDPHFAALVEKVRAA